MTRQSAIDGLKKGKAADTNGMKAEDFKGCDEESIMLMSGIFNLINKQNSIAPSSCLKVVIKVICKNGDPTKPEHYRPVCTLPTL